MKKILLFLGFISVSIGGWFVWEMNDFNVLTFVLPDGYKGPFIVVKRPETGVNGVKTGWRKYEFYVPGDGILELQDYSPLMGWEKPYGRYKNDPINSKGFLLKPITGGTLLRPEIGSEITYEWIYVGDDSGFDEAVKALNDSKYDITATNIKTYPRGVIKLPLELTPTVK